MYQLYAAMSRIGQGVVVLMLASRLRRRAKIKTTLRGGRYISLLPIFILFFSQLMILMVNY